MNDTICPEALKKYRNKRRLTQKALAEACRCSPEQVCRWENGKSLRVRKHLRERLTAVLKVSWEKLTVPPMDEDDQGGDPRSEQLNVRLRPEARAALDLVCHRYGLRRAQVVELAPLLLLIVAENSLIYRKKKLEEMKTLVKKAKDDIEAAAKHLDFPFALLHDFDDAISQEEDALKAGKVFNSYLTIDGELHDSEFSDPFTNYLCDIAEKTIKKFVSQIFPDNPVYYDFDTRLFGEALNLSSEDEFENKLLLSVSLGDPDFREVIEKKEAMPREEFIRWLSERCGIAEDGRDEEQALELEVATGDEEVDCDQGDAK